MSNRKPRKPRLRFKGIDARFSSGTWNFRARTKRHGHQHVGIFRVTQEEAADDYRALAGKLKAGGFSAVKTVGEAIEAVIAKARARGNKEITINGHITCHCRYILRFWQPDMPVASLTVKEVVWFITTSLKADRSPNTLLEKDLPMISRLMDAAGLTSPVPEAKEITSLRMVPRRKDRLEFADALAFVKNIRSATVLDKRGRPIRYTCRERHADLVELVLFTGARASQMANLTAASADFRSKILMLDGKTGRHNVAMDEELVVLVKRLIASAKKRGHEELIPGGLNGIGQIIQRWARRLGIKASTRALRHTIAFGMLESGAALTDVQAQLGHTRATTTNEYLKQRDQARLQPLKNLRKHYGLPDEQKPADGTTPKSE